MGTNASLHIRLVATVLLLALIAACDFMRDPGEELGERTAQLVSYSGALSEYYAATGRYPDSVADALRFGSNPNRLSWPADDYWGFPVKYVFDPSTPQQCALYSLGADNLPGGISRNMDFAITHDHDQCEFLDSLPSGLSR